MLESWPYDEGDIVTEAVIVAATRTPIGRAFKGSLTEVRPDDLAGVAISALLAQVPQVEGSGVDDVVVGCALTRGEAGYNLARQAGLLAGLPDTVPGTTVNRFCASSLQTIRIAAHAIKAGESDVIVAGGVDSSSRVPATAADSEALNPRFVDKARSDFINRVYIPMGITAENVAEARGISRERMDEYALLSHRRASAAQADGFSAREITPVPIPDGGTMTQDDGPRPDTSLDKLAGLSPAFKEDGTVTAGNSCPLSDGAAAVLVMSSVRAAELGVAARGRVVASAVTGLAPEMMGLGPIDAVRQVLSRSGLSMQDMDIVELNEAFASQVLACVDELGISIEDQLNPHGGAIALGHPFGMTGARIMTTLLNGLDSCDGTFGLETMCVGGGQGMAMIVERLA